MIEKTINKIKNKELVKIVCYGDSITYGYPCNAESISSQVNLPYPKILQSKLKFKFENSKISVINQGNVGWQSYQGYKHIHEKVIDLKPDLCLMMFGINDCKGSLAGGLPVSKKNYRNYLNLCVETLLNNNIEVLLLTPTPAIIPRLRGFVSIALDVAYSHNVHCINMYSEIRDTIKSRNEKYREVLLDGIHFRDDAYRYLSDIILKEFYKFA